MTGGFSLGQSGLSGWEIVTPITTAGPDATGFDLEGLGWAILVLSGLAGFSASISSAGLSLRRPLKAACRTLPSPVQPANSISATSSGRVQCMLPSLRGLTLAANGLVLLSTFSSSGSTLRITAALKPVPTRPTGTSLVFFPRPRCTPTISERSLGPSWVQPPMITSWPPRHLALSQLPLRVDW